MRTHYLIAVSTALALSLSSCHDTPAHYCYTPVGLSDYMPYSIGDTLRFASEDNDTLEYILYDAKNHFEDIPHTSLCGTYYIEYIWNEFDVSYRHFFMHISVIEDSTTTQRLGKAWSGEVTFYIYPYNVEEMYSIRHAKFDAQSNMESADFADTIVLKSRVCNNTATIVKGKGLIGFHFEGEGNYIEGLNNKTYTLVQD